MSTFRPLPPRPSLEFEHKAAKALLHQLRAGDLDALIEAFVVAMFNGRIAVLEDMVSRGTPVNSLVYGTPVINIAAGNAWTPVVECLVRCGANPDLPGWHPNQSAREIARGWFEQMPEDADRRRTVELLGMDPDAILAERDARPETPRRDS